MSHDFTMDKRTRQAYMLYHEDGLLDIYLGFTLVMFGLLLIVDYAAFTGVAFALLYPMFVLAKENITTPRLRPDELSPAQAAKRIKSMSMMLTVTLVIGVLVFMFVSTANLWLAAWLDKHLMTAVVIVLAGLFILWGLQSSTERLFVYAGLFVLARLASFWLTLAFPYYVLAVGAVISLIGLTVTLEFMRHHPKLGTG